MILKQLLEQKGLITYQIIKFKHLEFPENDKYCSMTTLAARNEFKVQKKAINVHQ